MHPLLVSARRLTDDELLAAVGRSALNERRSTAELVAHLAEIESRDLALREGYGSLFDYCRRGLRYSESEAFGRVEAARAARRFPLVLDMLVAGELTMTAVVILGRHLTPENHDALLRQVRGRTKEQLKELVVSLAPKPTSAPVLRHVPTVTTLTSVLSPPVPHVPLPAAAPPAAAVEPVAPSRFRYHVTIDENTRDLLNAARDLASHAALDDSVLMHRALSLLVTMLARDKFADTKRPRKGRRTARDSRHIAAEVKRVVWVRDAGRCAYVSHSGRRCEQRRFLEFHHVKPWQAGGESTVENIQLRCRAHNQYEARTYFVRDRVTSTPAGADAAATAPAATAPAPPRALAQKTRGAAVPRPPSPGVLPGA